MSFYILSSQPVFTLGLRRIVKSIYPNLKILEATNFYQFKDILTNNEIPNLLLVDVSTVITNTESVFALLRSMCPQIPIIALCDLSNYEEQQHYLRLGATVCLPKSASIETTTFTLQGLLPSSSLNTPPPTQLERATDAAVTIPQELSKRRRQLIALVAQGLSNKEISHELGISEHTVKIHFGKLFKIFGVNSRTKMLHLARVHGHVS